MTICFPVESTAVTSPVAMLPITSSLPSPFTSASTWSTPGPTNGSASGWRPPGLIGQPGTIFPSAPTAYTRPVAPIALVSAFVTTWPIAPATLPGTGCGCCASPPGPSSFVGATISGLPSPLMSPVAALLIDSAPTRFSLGLFSFIGKPGSGWPFPSHAYRC